MFFKDGVRNLNDMFKKGKKLAETIFQKSRGIASSVSRGAKVAGNVLGEVANVGQSILSNPTVRDLAKYNDTTKRAYDIANKATNTSMLGSSLANQVSRFTDEGSYQGSHEQNLRDALSRSKNIAKEANLFHYI